MSKKSDARQSQQRADNHVQHQNQQSKQKPVKVESKRTDR